MVEHAYVLREEGRCAGAPRGARLADYDACLPFSRACAPGLEEVPQVGAERRVRGRHGIGR
jgi:hypothetical protein